VLISVDDILSGILEPETEEEQNIGKYSRLCEAKEKYCESHKRLIKGTLGNGTIVCDDLVRRTNDNT